MSHQSVGRLIASCVLTCSLVNIAWAQHGGPASQGVWVPPRIDVIGPLGNRLPPSHRRTYNRPTYVGGKIAHVISPTSQEAMSWNRSKQRGLYQHPKRPHTDLYLYPKPWDMLPIGPRRPTTPVQSSDTIRPYDDPVLVDPPARDRELVPAGEDEVDQSLPSPSVNRIEGGVGETIDQADQ